ncbi:MAG: TraR/DksA C4-type zinc finger protein [Planctomycetes bacterium]|nr:TraR/DksA C4-type zinc finger protein [Planctomycetota bacterium]MBI3833740.1 TraR/DksA C4-type zinc finger protein [Planctomycetota bacterium]
MNQVRLVAAELPNVAASANHKNRRNGEARGRTAPSIAADKSLGGTKKSASEPTGRNRSMPKHAPPVKTHLTDKQLVEFKELLLLKRAQLTGDVQGLATEARGRSAQGDSEHSNMPIHMADLGSDTWEQDFTLGLIVNAESVVREIDAALERIKDRTYGICTVGDDRIGIARLRAKPWAKYCIEHARLIEEGRLP